MNRWPRAAATLAISLAGVAPTGFVANGYGTSCGDYELVVEESVGEILECPDGAMPEGEPDCHDDYVDGYDGGCGSHPIPTFREIHGIPDGGRFEICGTAGNFSQSGVADRDTDWYRLVVTEENTITFDCSAGFPVTSVLLDASGGCGSPVVLAFAEAAAFPDRATIRLKCPPGEYWYWVAPSVFLGVECGTLYVLAVEGYTSQPIGVAPRSWGRVKALYR